MTTCDAKKNSTESQQQKKKGRNTTRKAKKSKERMITIRQNHSKSLQINQRKGSNITLPSDTSVKLFGKRKYMNRHEKRSLTNLIISMNIHKKSWMDSIYISTDPCL